MDISRRPWFCLSHPVNTKPCGIHLWKYFWNFTSSLYSCAVVIHAVLSLASWQSLLWPLCLTVLFHPSRSSLFQPKQSRRTRDSVISLQSLRAAQYHGVPFTLSCASWMGYQQTLILYLKPIQVVKTLRFHCQDPGALVRGTKNPEIP